MKAVFGSAFEEDFAEIVTYYADAATLDLSLRFENSVVETFERIVAHPEIGRRRKDLAHPEIRSLVVSSFESYIIFYQARKDSVLFVRLLHGARNLPELL